MHATHAATSIPYTRTIIMSREVINLDQSKDMLLDVENQDAERVNAAVGSKPTVKPTSTATALVTNGPPKRVTKKKKKKKRRPSPKDDPKKSEKYHSEGPCSYHGSRCGHASSECWELHPELKATAAVAEVEGEAYAATTAIATREQGPTPFGFLNEDWGYGLVTLGEEVNTAGDEEFVYEFDLRRCARMRRGRGSRTGTEPNQVTLVVTGLGEVSGRPKAALGAVQTGAITHTNETSRLPVLETSHVKCEVANTRNDVEPDNGLQLQCASLIEWISKTAMAPYASINAAVKEADHANTLDMLQRAVEYGAKSHLWMWM